MQRHLLRALLVQLPLDVQQQRHFIYVLVRAVLRVTHLPEFVPRAQQNHAYKRPPHAQGVCNLVIAHVRVIAHHQGHASAQAQFVERSADFFAGAFFDQFFQLIGLRRFQWHLGDVFRFLALADPAAAQHVPAMIGGNFVQPRRKRAALIVHGEFVAQLDEYLHRGVFRVLPCRHRAAAETKNRRGILPV